MMEVSKSGFYKWKCRSPEDKIPDREKAMALITKVHEEHGSHGYRWVAAYMRINGIATYSDSFVFKAWKHLGFKAKTKHQHGKRRVAKKKDPFPNLIFSTWDLVDRPRQVIVSDMTSFVVWWTYYELTLYFDVFTKQILAWHLAGRRGDRLQYITGLEDVLDLLSTEGVSEPVILHTDQGSVYSSMAYNELIHDSVILRSMSRSGLPVTILSMNLLTAGLRRSCSWISISTTAGTEMMSLPSLKGMSITTTRNDLPGHWIMTLRTAITNGS